MEPRALDDVDHGLGLIGLLAIVATSFAFMVSIQVLKTLTPFESAMAINLEPIYAIVLVHVLFDERFEPGLRGAAW